MPTPQSSDNHQPPPRPRANTTSFASASFWRRGRPEATLTPASPPSQPLPLEALIEALTPPAVPSLTHARSLASVLQSSSPIPRPASLNPVLASLCAFEAPYSLQAAGYDILSAYWENNEAISLQTADRLTYFSLFLGPSISWSSELWEPRFRALRALTKYGADVVGFETAFLNVLKGWIEGAFEGLLTSQTHLEHTPSRAERERSFEVLAAFLTSVVERPEVVARLPDGEVSGVLLFYANLVDRAVIPPPVSESDEQSIPPSPLDSPSAASTPSRPTYGHNRTHSSLSISSLPQPQSPSHAPVAKNPADLAVSVYLNHLDSLLKTTSPNHLDSIVPLLCRALAYQIAPLPRLSITPMAQDRTQLDHRIVETLDGLLSGPYATSCIIVLKGHLFPPAHRDDNLRKAIQTSLGAQRTLRNYIRKSLCARLARAYISQDQIAHYSSGVTGDLVAQAYAKDEVSMWDASKVGRVLYRSIQAWISFKMDGNFAQGTSREKILEEAAGTIKDVLEEVESRETPYMDDEEASAVGETLYGLATYVLSFKYVHFISENICKRLTP